MEDGQFILKDFYDSILELFEDEDNEWVIETLTGGISKLVFTSEPA